jgi:hypothetical protein
MRQNGRVQRGTAIVGALVAVGVLGGAYAMQRGGDDPSVVQVVFGESDGVPEMIEHAGQYVATFTIDWSGPVAMRDGLANVFASRLGDTSEDAPDDGWPLVCESEFDDEAGRSRLVCPFVAPGPGEFALLLEVLDSAGEPLGEGIYTHLVVSPDSMPTP